MLAGEPAHLLETLDRHQGSQRWALALVLERRKAGPGEKLSDAEAMDVALAAQRAARR